jgi:hypothetical protein
MHSKKTSGKAGKRERSTGFDRTEHNQKSVHKHVGPFGGRQSLSAALRAVCQAKQPHAAAAVQFALRRHSAGQWSPRELPVACVWRLVCGA